jgi:ABC-type glycerol-3-phosphate transport system permease component
MVANRFWKRFWQIAVNAVLLVVVFLFLMPYLYMVSSSLKEGGEIFSIPIKLLPQGVFFGNWRCSAYCFSPRPATTLSGRSS